MTTHDIPEMIEGVRCSLEVHRGHGTRGLRVQCSPHGGNCIAYRSLHFWTAEFGSSAAVFVVFKVAGSAERMSLPLIVTKSGGLGGPTFRLTWSLRDRDCTMLLPTCTWRETLKHPPLV